MNSMWPKRPKLNEEDEDILTLRDDFVRGKCLPSANFSRCKKEASSGLNEETTIKNTPDPDYPKQVLFDVVERDVVDFDMPMAIDCMKAFPPKKIHNVNTKHKKSIFLQRLKSNESKVETPESDTGSSVPAAAQLTSRSFVTDGSGLGADGSLEVQRLHEENVNKISSMSIDEISALRQELLSSLGQDKINFLRSKRNKECLSENRPGLLKENFPKQRSRLSSLSLTAEKRNNLSGDPNEVTLKEDRGFDYDGLLLEEMADCEATDDKTPKADAVPEIPLAELPINPEDSGRWMHMNVLEKDKLAWMTMLPKPKPVDTKTGYAARFDFEGQLLRRENDVPTQMGLHHHANEPEVPGYSIEELFLLSRSSFQSQRITALGTLGHILENYWDGRFDDCFDTSLLSTLLQAGLAPLLRWALDDTTVSSVAAAISAIHSLLVCRTDELCLDWVYGWLNGHISPFLSAENTEPCTNLEELTDANVIKLNVITGFLRMDILPRFRYILRVLCPPSSVCELLIEICIRIARHSVSSAKEVAECPFLMEAVFQKFLPVHWSCSYKNTDTLDYFCPMASAVKLVRVISSASKSLALNLMENHSVIKSLECYLTIDPSEDKFPPAQVQKLVLESLRLWQTLLSYGFCTDTYRCLMQIVYRQLLFCERLSISASVEQNRPNYEFATHLLKVLETVISVASESDNQFASAKVGSLLPVQWTDIAMLPREGSACLKHWLHEYALGESSFAGQMMLASGLNFMSLYFSKCHQSEMPYKSDIDSIVQNYLLPVLSSKEFSKALNCLSSFSLLLSNAQTGCKRDSGGLPSLGCVLWRGDLAPLLQEASPFSLLASVFNFLHLYAMNHQVPQEILSAFPTSAVEKYLTSIASLKKISFHWFCRFEVELLYHMTRFLHITELMPNDLLYRVSLVLISCIASPNESMFLQSLFETIIFNEKSFSNSNVDRQNANSKYLSEICTFYCSTFIPLRNLEISRCFFYRKVHHASLSFDNQTAILPPLCWPLVPLMDFYKLAKSNRSDEPSHPEIKLGVISILRWMLLSCSNTSCSSLNDIPMTIRFIHLCAIFLIDSEIFHDETVKQLLYECLQDILRNEPNLDLRNSQWDDIPNFEEIYAEMLVQFEAVSYGDELFSNFIAIPLQQIYPSSWRLMFLSDHEQIAFFLRLPLCQLMVPVENFLRPLETDENVLQKYFRLLFSGKILQKRSPLLYLIAVHHLHHIINGSGETAMLWHKRLQLLTDKEVRNHIANYSSFDLNSNLGFVLTNSASR